MGLLREFPQHGRERQRSGDALTTRHEIGNDSVMLEREELPGASEPGLHLIEGEQGAVSITPLAELPSVLRGEEIGPDPEVRLRQDEREGEPVPSQPW